MLVRPGFLFAVLALALATACPGSTSSSPEFRSGAREIHRGRATDVEAAANCLLFFDQCIEEHLYVADATRDGDRLAVIVGVRLGRRTIGRLLFRSDDLGETWTSSELATPEGTIDQAVHLASGKAWVLQLRPTDGDLGKAVWWARPEPDTGGSLRMGAGTPVLSGTSATQAWSYVQSPYTSMGWNRYDLATLKATGSHTFSPTAELPYVAGGDWRTPDGQHFRAFTRRSMGTTHEYCQLEMFPGTDALLARCVPRLSWPLPLTEGSAPRNLVAQGSVFELQQALGGVWAATIQGEPPQAAAPLWLGAGTLVSSDGVHPRFGGYLKTSASTSLRGLGASGVTELDLPLLACDAPPCGYGPSDGIHGQLQWALPLGDDEWLLFHVVDVSDEGNEEVLVLSRTRVAPRAIQPHAPPRSPIPALPDATPPKTPLERSCAFEAGCNGAPGSYVYTCVRAWMPVCGRDSEHDAQWQARLAVREDCTALGPAVPSCGKSLGQIPAAQCTGCDPQGRLVSCTTQGSFAFGFSQDCAGLGLQCTTPQVTDFITNPKPICTPGICPMSKDTKHCDGPVEYGCYGELIDGRRDCSRAGMSCVQGVGCTLGTELRCPAELDERACHGDLVPYCFEGRTRYVECRAMGFSGCANGGCVR